MRYFGYILIVVAAVGWSIGIGAILLRHLGARLVQGDAIVVAGFDRTMVPDGQRVLLYAMIIDADTGLPTSENMLVFRFDDGRTAQAPVGGDGFTNVPSPPGLGIGAHRFTVDLPDARPRLDVGGTGTAWVWPSDTHVLWIDAGALFHPHEAATADPAAVARQADRALVAIKTLAVGRLPVYLVSCQARQYPAARRLIEAAGAPRGPVLWMQPGAEATGMDYLKRVWPKVDAAALATPVLLGAAERVTAEVWRVPPAGPAQEAPGTAPEGSPGTLTWDDVLQGVPDRRGM